MLKGQFEPRHGKTNKVSECPAKTQISLGTHSLCWFCHVTARLIQVIKSLSMLVSKNFECLKFAENLSFP